MTLVHVNDVTLHTQVLTPTGVTDPPTAVLLHGLATDSMASWYFTLAYPLVEAGYRVVLLDLRGHGRSERPPLRYALDDFVDDLEGLLDRETGPHLLLGNSFGGTIAFGYAARHPERVAGIVAIESSPPTPAWFARLCTRLSALEAAVSRPRALATVGARRGVVGARRAQDAARLLAATSLRQELPASRLPSPARIHAITCPVLCLYGERSHVVGLAAETVRLLPQTAVRVFAGQKHTLLIDQPENVWTAVRTWLRTRKVGG
jgi:pimeloyl-ACP methyl ester carboxylesterase